jgi:hypothetical protein
MTYEIIYDLIVQKINSYPIYPTSLNGNDCEL